MFNKANCIFNVVWYSILILFGVYFCLCPFVIYVNEDLSTWQIFAWGALACLEFVFGGLGLGYSIGELIEHNKQKTRNLSDDKDKWY